MPFDGRDLAGKGEGGFPFGSDKMDGMAITRAANPDRRWGHKDGRPDAGCSACQLRGEVAAH